MDDHPADRLKALGNELVEIHVWLRAELDQLREDLNGERLRDLKAHCMTFCSAVSRHHKGEDGGGFLVMAEKFPQLRPALDELSRDHVIVADVLRKLESLTVDPDPADPVRVRAELDGLAALLESHFAYEEKKLVAALNSLTAGTTESLFGVRPESYRF